MKKISKVLWGIVLIVLGIIIGCNALGYTHINIFFDGWWTLFIIIPCFIDLFNGNESKVGNLIGIAIGVILMLACNGLFDFDIILKLIVPIILVIIGLSMIFNETIKSEISKKVKQGKKDGLENIVATFAEQNVNKDNEDFRGADVEAIFGGVNLNIKNANLGNETYIKTTSIFGGIEIIVPSDVNVKVKSTPIFGGVSNKCVNQKESTKVIYVDAFSLFGGVDIK